MAFKPIRFIEGMSASSKRCFFEPRFILIERTSLDPIQPVDGFAVVTDQEVLPKSKQTMHHLPRSMIRSGKQSLTLDFASVVHQFDERICRLLNSTGRRANGDA